MKLERDEEKKIPVLVDTTNKCAKRPPTTTVEPTDSQSELEPEVLFTKKIRKCKYFRRQSPSPNGAYLMYKIR